MTLPVAISGAECCIPSGDPLPWRLGLRLVSALGFGVVSAPGYGAVSALGYGVLSALF